jgi:hypothetical protein
MKKLKYLLLLMMGFLMLNTGCEEDSLADDSEITYLPALTMFGDANVVLDCSNTDYTDAGLEALESGQPIPVVTTVEGKYYGSSVVDQADDYVIGYQAYNKDSIPGAAFRSVFWPVCNSDMVTSIEGMYKANVVRNGSVDPTYQDLQYIFIRDMGNNVYQLSDAIGGYYDFGRGYGFHYAGTGMTVTANDIPGNDFTYGANIGVGDFGGDLEMTAFSVDAANKTINFTTEWSFGFTFVVELIQVSL